MATVKAITITVDSLLPRLKLDCDVGYDMAMKGVSVAVVYSWEDLRDKIMANFKGFSSESLTASSLFQCR